jgi:hypothetical protein
MVGILTHTDPIHYLINNTFALTDEEALYVYRERASFDNYGLPDDNDYNGAYFA